MHLVNRFVVAAALSSALWSGPAAAGSFPFTLHNFTGSDITGVSVKNGEVRGFERLLARQSLTFTVDFPDGACIAARVRVKFANGGHSDHPNYDVCSGQGITVVGP